MNNEEWKQETIILRGVRLGFPNLFKPIVNPQYPLQKPSCSAQFEIEKDSSNHILLMTAIKSVLKAHYGEKAGKKLIEFSNNKMKYPVKDGDDMDKEWASGKVFLTAKRQQTLGLPRVIDYSRADILADDNRITKGSIVNLKVIISSQPGVNDGVRARIEVVQWLKAGTDSAANISIDDFEEIEVSDDEDLI